uniref:BTB domain-containing protein n=1 Tax=Strigamia maritima TaxID=126957 RepID=T1J2X0_STRMM
MNEKRRPNKPIVLTPKPKLRLKETTGSTTDLSDDSNGSSTPDFLLSSTKILNDLRKGRIFTDIDLECIGSGISYAAHSFVLASSSGFFRTYFITKFHEIDPVPQVKRSKSSMRATKDAVLIRRKISLEITPENLATLLEFMYTGCLILPLDINRLKSIITSAQKLKIPKFVSYMVDSLRTHLTISTNTLLWNVALELDHRKLREEIVRFLAKRIDQLAESRELFSMSFSRLKAVCQYLQSNSNSHDEILGVILLWVKHDPKMREKDFPILLRSIDVKCISSLYIAVLVRSEPLVRRADRFWEILSVTHVDRVNRNKKIVEFVPMTKKQASATEHLRVRSSLCNELPLLSLKTPVASVKSATSRTSSTVRVVPKRATASITNAARLTSQKTLDDDALSPRSRRFLSKNKRFLYEMTTTFDLQSDAMGDAGRRSDYKKTGCCN